MLKMVINECVCIRGLNSTQAVQVVEEAMLLQRNFPDIMAGFDFVSTTRNAITEQIKPKFSRKTKHTLICAEQIS